MTVGIGQDLEFHVAGIAEEFSMYTVSLPKAVRASSLVRLMALIRAVSELTTRIPRPPPPPAALMMTG